MIRIIELIQQTRDAEKIGYFCSLVASLRLIDISDPSSKFVSKIKNSAHWERSNMRVVYPNNHCIG